MKLTPLKLTQKANAHKYKPFVFCEKKCGFVGLNKQACELLQIQNFQNIGFCKDDTGALWVYAFHVPTPNTKPLVTKVSGKGIVFYIQSTCEGFTKGKRYLILPDSKTQEYVNGLKTTVYKLDIQ